jgi:hypothetical protein
MPNHGQSEANNDTVLYSANSVNRFSGFTNHVIALYAAESKQSA